MDTKQREVYGFTNCAFFSGPNPDGYTVWFPTRKERDIALAALRQNAVERGLSEGASRAGIYPVKRRIDSMTGEAWLTTEQIETIERFAEEFVATIRTEDLFTYDTSHLRNSVDSAIGLPTSVKDPAVRDVVIHAVGRHLANARRQFRGIWGYPPEQVGASRC